jgi:LmbE family N-acetylglucosaminyl deacetylase
VHTNDETTQGQESAVQRQEPDRGHPNFCAQCYVVHPETIAEIDARLTREREQRYRRPLTRLIVAPHCDDEALGCGGLIAKFPEQCSVVVLARPDEIRRKEFEEARAILGYSDAHFLHLPDGYVGADMAHLVRMLDELLAEVRPDELYLPYPSMHQDHIAGYEAGVRTSRLSMSEGHWFAPSVFVYDVAAYDLDLYPTDLKWNTFEALSEEHIDAKTEATAQYASQRVLTPHPANSIKKQAEATGAARQVLWAEQYAMVRAVRR